jgi:hypothetical protein
MPKAILHVGTMKTGTTSIQAALADNKDVLADHGYNYLGPPMRHSSMLEPALEAIPDPTRNLIISDEGMWHFNNSRRSDTVKLAKILGAAYDVTVLIYLRRPDSFLNSWFQQGLKSGTGTLTMTNFLASSFVRAGMEFEKTIARFEALFGPNSIKLRAYEKSQLVDGDAVHDFLDTIGLPVDKFDLPERANTTPDTDSLLLRSLFRRDAAQSAQLTKRLDTLNHHLTRYGYKGRRYNLLTQTELDDIIGTYRPVFIKLQTQYGGGVTPNFFKSWPKPDQVDDRLLGLRWTQEALLKAAG